MIRGYIMDCQDWLLLAIGDTIEPIKLQKALFKFAKESGAPPTELYEFEPYNWGPCSFEIYEDIKDLRERGLVEAIPSGRGWNIYRLTSAGQEREEEIRESSDPRLIKQMDDARQFVTDRNFMTLLTDVYEEYPEYAVNSLFNR
jgi:uncharacterized protein YwgA